MPVPTESEIADVLSAIENMAVDLPAPTGDVHSELLTALKAYRGPLPTACALEYLTNESELPALVQHGVEVRYPRQVADLCGELGLVIPAAKLLLWISEDPELPATHSAHLKRVAADLREDGEPQEFMGVYSEEASPLPALAGALAVVNSCSDTMRADARNYLCDLIRMAVHDTVRGGSGRNLTIHYPPEPELAAMGCLISVVTIPTGEVLSYAARELEPVNPEKAQRLRTIVDGW
jgi:hypothetical protein